MDGKQRLEAVRKFLRDELLVFGAKRSDFTDNMRLTGPRFSIWINDLKTNKDVLAWYLEMNTGGTPHTEEELNKVKKMLTAS
mgnify:CR=1 FL=1